jgi:hypothetical protein
MKELSFQVQLYKIVHVKNIINVSLSILNIGNCDVVTFESLVDFLTSYRFSSKSNLKKLSLGLVKSVINLNMEIYSLLFQIFNVKITNLLELNIYTNIILNEDKEYIYLLNIFNNNWISKSVFTLNKVSDNIINMKECLDKKNQIKFFVPYSAENECLSPEEKKKMVSIRKNNEIKNDEIVNQSKNSENILIKPNIISIKGKSEETNTNPETNGELKQEYERKLKEIIDQKDNEIKQIIKFNTHLLK